MAWFFTQSEISDCCEISGEDALHIKKSLRMKAGEELTLVSPSGTEHRCVIESIESSVKVRVLAKKPSRQEPDVMLTLYQGITKGDKMDLIIQKAVELGVCRIVPTVTHRCVSRPDEKSMAKKLVRWQKIALGAAMQSRRGCVPTVMPMMTLADGAKKAAEDQLSMVFYEGGGESLNSLLTQKPKTVSIFVGSEGGFEESEIKTLNALGVKSATLGKRILRTETAPLAAATAIMLLTGNLE